MSVALKMSVFVVSLCISITVISAQNCQSTLAKSIFEILENPLYERATWGIQIEGTQKNGGTPSRIFSLIPKNYRIPASNNKLLTTSALYMSYLDDVTTTRFTTPFLVKEGERDTPSVSTLCVKGYGDPSLTLSQLKEAVESLRVKQIDSLIMDSSLYQSTYYGGGQPFSGSWQWEDITSDYGAHPTPFIINENAFTVIVTAGKSVGDPPVVTFSPPDVVSAVPYLVLATTSKITNTLQVEYVLGSPYLLIVGQFPLGATGSARYAALNSTSFFESLLLKYFDDANVVVGNVSGGICDDTFSVTRSLMKSPTWDVLLNHTLQESDNLYAEVWMRVLGVDAGGSSPTLTNGINAVKSILSSHNVSSDGYRQIDGSGVSVQNLFAPSAAIELLTAINNLTPSQADLYISFLPLAGESGTLSDRFIGTDAQGKVRAKTGTLTGVNALSGYVDNDMFDSLLFSIIVNESNQPASTIRQGIDAIVTLLPTLDPTC